MTSRLWVTIVLLTFVAACQPTSSAGPGRDSTPVPAAGVAGPKTLTVAYRAEPANLILPFAGQSGAQGGADLSLAVHQRLVTYDEHGGLHPMLSTNIPSQADGTWIVRPDGTMRVTYTLRADVTWHDGAPFVAQDVVLGWKVSSDAELPVDVHKISDQISAIDTPDPHTLVIEWKAPYPFANATVEEDLTPLPTHLLADTYETDKARLVQSSYWTRDFVGLGPFQVGEWEAGDHIVLNAYDAFFAGRAKIDRLVVRFIADDSTAVAQLLAGTLDGDFSDTVQFGQAMFVKRQWEDAGQHPTAIVQPTRWRFWYAQFRDPSVPEILDVRVRRALLVGIDRQQLVDTLLEGQVPVSDSMIPPNDPKADWVKDVVTVYPYNPQLATQLFADAGWRRGGDGMLANAAGQPLDLPARTQPGASNTQELAIIADQWKSLGINVEQDVMTTAQLRDARYMVSFPGFFAAQIPLTFAGLLARVDGPNCPTEANRWVGYSWGCYQNPDLDAAIAGLKEAIDPNDQRALWRDVVRIESEDLPVLPLYFNATVTLFRDGVTGVRGHTIPKTSATWNAAEWDVRRP